MRASRLAAISSVVFFLSVVAWIALVSLRRSLLLGLCCADDGYFALVAKTFANHLMYALPQSSTAQSMFDPNVGSGPALIIPGAVMIAIFGSQHWVPGMTSIVLFVCQTVASVWILAWTVSVTRACLFYGIALLGLVSVMRFQNYFGVYVGEAPAFGFLILGGILLFSRHSFRWKYALAGVTLSLAFQTKQIALFAILGMVGTWFLAHLQEGRATGFKELSLLGISASLPILLFEIAKSVALGPSAYLGHLVRTIQVSIAYSIGGPTERGAAFLAALKDNYLIETNIAVCALVALILTVVALVWSGAGEARGRSGILFGLALFTAGAAHLAYILSLSRMWPRYYWLGIGLLSFATAVPVLVCKWPLGLGFTVMLAVLFVTPARLAHFQEMAMASADGRLPAEQANVLGIIGDHPELPIMSQWWGSSYEIFYLLRDERVWWVGNDPELLRNRTSLVVMNDHFADKTAPFYLTVRENCRGIPTGGERYRVFYCDGTRGWSAHGR